MSAETEHPGGFNPLSAPGEKKFTADTYITVGNYNIPIRIVTLGHDGKLVISTDTYPSPESPRFTRREEKIASEDGAVFKHYFFTEVGHLDELDKIEVVTTDQGQTTLDINVHTPSEFALASFSFGPSKLCYEFKLVIRPDERVNMYCPIPGQNEFRDNPALVNLSRVGQILGSRKYRDDFFLTETRFGKDKKTAAAELDTRIAAKMAGWNQADINLVLAKSYEIVNLGLDPAQGHCILNLTKHSLLRHD